MEGRHPSFLSRRTQRNSSFSQGTWRGADVAIKQLHLFDITDVKMVEEFKREAACMALVGNHPNIVKVLFVNLS